MLRAGGVELRGAEGAAGVRADEGAVVVVVVEVTVAAVALPGCPSATIPLCTFSERTSAGLADAEVSAEAFVFTKRCSFGS